jgi:hypothetical protein
MELPLIQHSNATFQSELSQLMPNADFNFITANAQGSMISTIQKVMFAFTE